MSHNTMNGNNPEGQRGRALPTPPNQQQGQATLNTVSTQHLHTFPRWPQLVYPGPPVNGGQGSRPTPNVQFTPQHHTYQARGIASQQTTQPLPTSRRPHPYDGSEPVFRPMAEYISTGGPPRGAHAAPQSIPPLSRGYSGLSYNQAASHFIGSRPEVHVPTSSYRHPGYNVGTHSPRSGYFLAVPPNTPVQPFRRNAQVQAVSADIQGRAAGGRLQVQSTTGAGAAPWFIQGTGYDGTIMPALPGRSLPVPHAPSVIPPRGPAFALPPDPSLVPRRGPPLPSRGFSPMPPRGPPPTSPGRSLPAPIAAAGGSPNPSTQPSAGPVSPAVDEEPESPEQRRLARIELYRQQFNAARGFEDDDEFLPPGLV